MLAGVLLGWTGSTTSKARYTTPTWTTGGKGVGRGAVRNGLYTHLMLTGWLRVALFAFLMAGKDDRQPSECPSS